MTPFLKRLRLFGREKGHSLRTAVEPITVLAEGCESSIAYFLRPEMARRGWAHTMLDLKGHPPSSLWQYGIRTLIIVRYLNKPWAQAVLKFRKEGGRVIYFMDDDLMDPSVLRELPAGYARKIEQFATRWKELLEEVCHEFWTSTEHLAEKYSGWNAAVLVPGPINTRSQGEYVETFYHGTASHIEEIRWLAPVIADLQREGGGTRFEIFGDHIVNRMFRSISGVSVLHPMSWTNYLEYTATTRKDIGLAPLLPSNFNAARSVTKFYDFARMGAFGIYSDVAPYNQFVRHDVDGILLPNDADVWVKTLSCLAKDPARRRNLAQAARMRAENISAYR